MIKAAIFDLDNTLYDFFAAHNEAYSAVADYAQHALGLSRQDFDALHRWGSRALEESAGRNSAAIHNRLIRYQLMLEHTGRPLLHAPEMARRYWNTLLDCMTPFPDAHETLEKLRAMGLKVGIGTNMTAELQFEKLDRIGLLPLIDFIVTSEEVSAEKPDARLFHHCAFKAACEREACAFIGDNLRTDALGAAAAGLRGIWFHPGDSDDGTPEGILRVSALARLPELLSTL